MKTRHEREHDLVALMLYDRPALYAIYERVTGLPKERLTDREVIRTILENEFPTPRGDNYFAELFARLASPKVRGRTSVDSVTVPSL